MGVRRFLGSAISGFAKSVLDLDDTRVPQEQLSALQDLLARQSFNTIPSDLKELVIHLKQKHVVDSISISETNGSLLASSNAGGVAEVITASALFNYVQSEFPKSEVVMVHTKDSWSMLFKFNGKIFVIRAPSHLTTIELRAISNEVDLFLSERAQKGSSVSKKAEQ